MSFRTSGDYCEYEHDNDVTDIFAAGERLCAPSATARGSTLMPAVGVAAFLSTLAWLFMSYPAAWQAIASVVSMARVTEPQTKPPPEAAPAPQLMETRDIAAAPGAHAGDAAPPPSAEPARPLETVQSVDLAAQASAPQAELDPKAAASPQPLPPPKADPTDPNQKRALAAGLHPDLSRALLARLSVADYSNARAAIQTALAETPDDEVYTWPRKVTSTRAQFEVKFVASLSAACRRYVVIVTKDRWSTTAPPLEKCGGDLPKRKLARKVG